MTPISDVPLNSLTWLAGSLACFALCYRSYTQYRHSANELSKYLACFSLAMAIGQALLAIPAFITLNVGILRTTYQAGELFIYMSMVAQAAIAVEIVPVGNDNSNSYNRVTFLALLVAPFYIASEQ